MMTQTHLLAGAALFARPGERVRNAGVLVGSVLPDAAIYTLFAWSKLAAIPERRVWDELYWQEPWRTWVAAQNAVVVYIAIAVAAFFLLRAVRGAFRIGLFLMFLAAAALLHIAMDLPVHHADAHRHLWPFSDWVFRSPVSYWDPAHHGRTFMWIEAALGVLLVVVLWRRFASFAVRALLFLLLAAYLAVPAYFTLVLGGAT